MVANHNGGLVTYYSSNRLQDDQAQVAVNVLFDRDSGVAKRGGQQIYGTIPGCSAQIRAAGSYLSPSGQSYFFAACGSHVYVTSGTGNFAVHGATISSTANINFHQGLGVEWITDGVDPLWSTNGVAISSYPTAPLAKFAGIYQGRLALGNIVGSVSGVDLSGYNNGSDFTLPAVIVDTSPAVFGLNGTNDGRYVTCMSDSFRGVFVLWNRDEMYGLYGDGNSSFILRKLAEIGCDEQDSVQEFDGKLRWLSQFGVYQYDGLTTARISDPIKDLVQNIINTAPGYLSLLQTSQADWQAGNLIASGAGSPLSATISAGNVVPSTFDVVNQSSADWSLGTFSAPLSTVAASPGLALSTAAFYVLNGDFSSGSLSHWTCASDASDGQIQNSCAYSAVGGNHAAILVQSISDM